MKFFVALLLTILLSFIAGLYLPWWGIAITAFIAALLVHQKAWKAFLAGFLGLFLLWGALAEWIDVKNNHLLSARIGEVMGVGANPFLLVFVTAFVAGLVAGFAALSGSYLRKGK
jgi:hypothetical protein